MDQQLNHDDRVQMARFVMKLLDEWEVEPKERVSLLGLPGDTKSRSLTRFRQGDALPEDNEILLRTKNLMEIHHALCTTFPMNAAIARYWVTTENTSFNNMTPLDIMLEDGIEGMNRVRSHLDSDGSWN